jgi:hypothetical protein
VSPSALRRSRRSQTAALITSGAHSRRSHYQTGDIAAAVDADLREMRQQMEAQRGSGDSRLDVTPLEPGQKRRERAPDPHWAFRPSGTHERDRE